MKIWQTLLTIIVVGVFFWSGYGSQDRFTWILEVLPTAIGIPFLVYFHSKYKYSDLLVGVILVHGIVLCVGGRYTYAEVPLGFWLQDLFHFSRNHYDRIGHFFQGITPTLICIELFSRTQIVRRGFWFWFLSVCVALAFSAFYEMIEWWTALLTGESAKAFLGTQGDIWDTQWDMFFALLGGITAVVFRLKITPLKKKNG